MNSNDVKAAFANAGLKVRVRDLGGKFRICTIGDAVFSDRSAVISEAKKLGLTDSLGHLGGQFNQPQEFIGYKPGAIVRI